VDDLRIGTAQNVTELGGQIEMGAGFVTYTPPANRCGWDHFNYFVSDGQLGGDSIDTKWIFISETTPEAPVIVSCAPNVTTNPPALPWALPDLTPTLVAHDNCCCVTIAQDPAPGTPLGNGTHTVTFTVTDTLGLTATCQATVTVNASALPAVQIIQPDPADPYTFNIVWPAGTPPGVRVEYTEDIGAVPVTWTTDPSAAIVQQPDGSGVATVTVPPVPPSQVFRFYRLAL
jgi:hypothetical protein